MKNKGFIKCLSDFMSDSTGLTQEDIVSELQELGIDAPQLEERVAEIARKGSADRRLAWVKRARERRAEIEEMLKSKKIGETVSDLKDNIKEILLGRYGEEALSYAQAYFRKKETLSEKDLESLIEDLEDLDLLERLSGEEDE